MRSDLAPKQGSIGREGSILGIAAEFVRDLRRHGQNTQLEHERHVVTQVQPLPGCPEPELLDRGQPRLRDERMVDEVRPVGVAVEVEAADRLGPRFLAGPRVVDVRVAGVGQQRGRVGEGGIGPRVPADVVVEVADDDRPTPREKSGPPRL